MITGASTASCHIQYIKAGDWFRRNGYNKFVKAGRNTGDSIILTDFSVMTWPDPWESVEVLKLEGDS